MFSMRFDRNRQRRRCYHDDHGEITVFRTRSNNREKPRPSTFVSTTKFIITLLCVVLLLHLHLHPQQRHYVDAWISTTTTNKLRISTLSALSYSDHLQQRSEKTHVILSRRRCLVSKTRAVVKNDELQVEKNTVSDSDYSDGIHTTIAVPEGRQNTILPNIIIRDCTHGELNIVADIIMDSFYNYTTNANDYNIFKQLTKLAELNRIQSSYPYGIDRIYHKMLVAVMTTPSTTCNQICGFVDIDLRPPKPNMNSSYKYNPRPYLSDLCVATQYRRYGVASLLIAKCESYVCEHYNKKQKQQQEEQQQGKEVYIRVEANNRIAIQMYERLGYTAICDHPDSNNHDILILHKSLL